MAGFRRVQNARIVSGSRRDRRIHPNHFTAERKNRGVNEEQTSPFQGATDLMNNARNRRYALLFVCPLILLIVALTAAAFQKKSPATAVDPLIAGFKKSYPASVSDAVELVTGKNGTMRHDMKLMAGTNLVGRAVTALAKPAPPEQATPTLAVKHSVEIIDEAKPGDVGVIVMEGTLDIA